MHASTPSQLFHRLDIKFILAATLIPVLERSLFYTKAYYIRLLNYPRSLSMYLLGYNCTLNTISGSHAYQQTATFQYFRGCFWAFLTSSILILYSQQTGLNRKIINLLTIAYLLWFTVPKRVIIMCIELLNMVTRKYYHIEKKHVSQSPAYNLKTQVRRTCRPTLRYGMVVLASFLPPPLH